MTLITYPTRVHFADHVLEEALHSEIERVGCKHPLLVADREVLASELFDRVQNGLPNRTKADVLSFGAEDKLSEIARAAAESVKFVDVIVAFGSAPAVELGRKFRHLQSSKTGTRVPLFAIPSVDGLPNPCTGNIESWRSGLPTVLICDPTVAMLAGHKASLRSSILSLVRCVESYLSAAYNPLADGIALEGVSRCLINLPKIGQGQDITLQRELMAAGLNAALAQENGVGPALKMATALAETAENSDEVAIARLVLPAVIGASTMDADKASVLGKVIGDESGRLDQAMRKILSNIPLPESLADMGIPRAALDDVAMNASGLTYDHALDALKSIYESVEQ